MHTMNGTSDGRNRMAYCPKCGFQNADDATFCNKCGAPLKGPMPPMAGGRDRCEDECAGGRRGSSIFWGILVVLIGLGVLVWALEQTSVVLPDWVRDLNIGFLAGLLIAIALIVTGITIIIRRSRGAA